MVPNSLISAIKNKPIQGTKIAKTQILKFPKFKNRISYNLFTKSLPVKRTIGTNSNRKSGFATTKFKSVAGAIEDEPQLAKLIKESKTNNTQWSEKIKKNKVTEDNAKSWLCYFKLDSWSNRGRTWMREIVDQESKTLSEHPITLKREKKKRKGKRSERWECETLNLNWECEEDVSNCNQWMNSTMEAIALGSARRRKKD